MSIKMQVNYGIKWVGISTFFLRASRFITSIILARLLAPEMFGIIAMANVAIETIGIVRQIGVGSAFIQKHYDPKTEEIAANTTFIMALIVNAILFVFSFLVSPAIASFFNSDELEKILKVMFLLFIFDGLFMVPNLILIKKLEFGKHSICQVIESIFYAFIGISLAFFNFGVWSLVFAQLSSRLIFGILVFKISGWRPHFEFNYDIAKELFDYGKYIWGFIVVSTIGKAVDKSVVGKLWGSSSLGFYSIAFNLCTLLVKLISFMVDRIGFPVFSQMQEDHKRLRKSFNKVLSNVSIITIPLCLGLFAVSNEFIISIYGHKWEPVVPLVKVLAFYAMCQSLSSVPGTILKAIGKVNIILYSIIVQHVIMIILFFAFRSFGTIGVCYAVLIPMMILTILVFFFSFVYLDLRPKEVFEPILRAIFSGLIMVFAIRIFIYFAAFDDLMPLWLILTGSIILGSSVYILSSFLTNKSCLNDFRYSLIDVVQSKGMLYGGVKSH